MGAKGLENVWRGRWVNAQAFFLLNCINLWLAQKEIAEALGEMSVAHLADHPWECKSLVLAIVAAFHFECTNKIIQLYAFLKV